MRVSAFALLAFLAACDPPAGSNESGGMVDESLPRSGIYERTMVREAFVPGESAAKMNDVQRMCLQIDPNRPQELFSTSDTGCTDTELKLAHGEVTGRTSCDWPEVGGTVLFDTHGSYSNDRIELTSDGSIDGVPVRQTETYVRQGDCSA